MEGKREVRLREGRKEGRREGGKEGRREGGKEGADLVVAQSQPTQNHREQ